MKTLVVEKDGTLVVKEVAEPEIEEHQALVRVLSCGVCNGTDLKIIHGKFKGVDDYPAMLGHEAVGEVVRIGARVKSFKPGDRVLLPFVEKPLNGVYSAWGAFSEYAVIGDRVAAAELGLGIGVEGFNEAYYAQTIVPESIDPVDASMIITFREVLLGVKEFGIKANDTVLIFGAGPVGLCFTKFCHLLGCKTIVTLDIVESKLADAKAAGAHHALLSGLPDLAEKLREICPGGFDCVVDAVGMNGIINQAMGYIANGGRICVYGISPTLRMELDWSSAPYNWRLLFHQFPSKLGEYEANAQILNWIGAGVLNPRDFISDVFDFAQILDAFQLVEERRALGKVVIKY